MYIYNQIEVQKTGRIAKKYSRDKTRVIDILYEIKPKLTTEIADSWTKWVRETDLYIIVNKPNEE